MKKAERGFSVMGGEGSQIYTEPGEDTSEDVPLE